MCKKVCESARIYVNPAISLGFTSDLQGQPSSGLEEEGNQGTKRQEDGGRGFVRCPGFKSRGVGYDAGPFQAERGSAVKERLVFPFLQHFNSHRLSTILFLPETFVLERQPSTL